GDEERGEVGGGRGVGPGDGVTEGVGGGVDVDAGGLRREGEERVDGAAQGEREIGGERACDVGVGGAGEGAGTELGRVAAGVEEELPGGEADRENELDRERGRGRRRRGRGQGGRAGGHARAGGAGRVAGANEARC